jgi:hypothetical protein
LNPGPWVDFQDGIANPLRRFAPVYLWAAVTPRGLVMWLIVQVGGKNIPAVLYPPSQQTASMQELGFVASGGQGRCNI